jgi:hypothetical protein
MEFVSRKGVSPRQDSTESVVLHEDDGEEVAMPVSIFLASKQHPEESESDCVDDWLSNDVAYWNSGGRVRSSRRWKVLVDDVDKTAAKRKYDDCVEVSGRDIDEESDEEEASSSDSDASEYESAYNKRRKTQRSQVAEDDEELVHVDELKEMQLLLELQLKASERREAGMKQRMETMMELMSRHVGHVEKRVSTMEDSSQPQEQILERINVKLEQLMEGFSTLNENLSILSACLSRDLDSQR